MAEILLTTMKRNLKSFSLRKTERVRGEDSKGDFYSLLCSMQRMRWTVFGLSLLLVYAKTLEVQNCKPSQNTLSD